MTKDLISFPAEAMILSDEELRAAADGSHAVIEEAKAAGVYVFGGGIDESIVPVMVGGDGSVSSQTQSRQPAQRRLRRAGSADTEGSGRMGAEARDRLRCAQDLRVPVRPCQRDAASAHLHGDRFPPF